ncbi:hypothetical protein C8R43DRAFT_980829 [Mycena crocata]|nr:hypothetical protein C8R43DRAFT_980829 [Mycena crocata]
MNNRRKSMRRAADPCLGFYVLPPSPIPLPPRAPLDLPPIKASREADRRLSSDDDTCDEEDPVALTVDAFLRRSVQASAKTYRNKPNRPRPNRDDPPICGEMATPERPRRHAMSTQHRSKPLKKRLLSAVLSHTDPDDWLLQDSVQSKNPLAFSEIEDRRPLRLKRRTWSLVDPKKTLPARFNSFSNSRHNPSTRSPPKNKTLSGWQAQIYLDGSVVSKRKAGGKTAKMPAPLKCPPLSFVPLHEAERCYSMRRQPHKIMEAPKPKAIVIGSTKSTRIPLELAFVKERNFSPPQTAQQIANSEQTPCHPLSSMRTLAQADLPPIPADTLLNLSTTDLIPVAAIPPFPFDSSLLPPPVDDCDAAAFPPPPASPQCMKSTLKPLASFFDQFLQTARSETQLERTKHGKKRKTPRNVQSTIVSSKTSGVSKLSLRRPSSARRLVQAPDYRMSSPVFPYALDTFRDPATATTPRFHVPSSTSGFHPTPYQVVLPSTPPTSYHPTVPPTWNTDLDLPPNVLNSSVNLFCFNARICGPHFPPFSELHLNQAAGYSWERGRAFILRTCSYLLCCRIVVLLCSFLCCVIATDQQATLNVDG